jgi:hypothetical protein
VRASGGDLVRHLLVAYRDAEALGVLRQHPGLEQTVSDLLPEAHRAEASHVRVGADEPVRRLEARPADARPAHLDGALRPGVRPRRVTGGPELENEDDGDRHDGERPESLGEFVHVRTSAGGIA